jgi:hypothetical protein
VGYAIGKGIITETMGWAAIAWPKDTGINPGELLDVIGLPSEAEHAPKQLSGSANEMIRAVVSIMDDMVLSVLEKRTAEDFTRVRKEIFPRYFSALVALGALIRVAVPKHVLDRLIAESLSELEADFRDDGAATFGAELRDRGMFTVWTLRKINELADEVQKMSVQRTDSEEIVKQFVAAAVWARFHVDCLVKSIHRKKPIFPEVVEPIADGLRAAVNAYALIRQLVGTGVVEPELPLLSLDEEDEAWLADSMRDMTRESS